MAVTQPEPQDCTKQSQPRKQHNCRRPPGRGLTLVELLLTIAVLGILAAILIPQLSGDLPDRLTAGAQIVANDLDYARSLAVANNSSYRFTFDTANNLYFLQHSGTNTQFNTLPRSPYRQVDDPVDKQTTKLSMLPLPEPSIKLVAVVQMQGSGQSSSTLEFNSLGGTTSAYQTILWLTCGSGSVQRYISVIVDPITGLVTIGPVRSAVPVSIVTVVQQALADQSAQAVPVGS